MSLLCLRFVYYVQQIKITHEQALFLETHAIPIMTALTYRFK